MKRSPIQVPATAPSGGRGRVTSSPGTTTPHSPERSRSRKPSSATPSLDETPPRRPSAWTTRPSMVGVMAASRLGMGVLRKVRTSYRPTAGSRKGGSSTCGERPDPPLPSLEPTYRLESKCPFRPAVVEELIQTTLNEHLKDRSYHPSVATLLCRKLSDDLRDRVKKLGFDRYRLVVSVAMGERRDQGVVASSRCAWDDRRDNFATATFQAPDFFCTASVFGVYKE
ncbi:dynein light chain Tctex-type 5-like [Babylonia areolata]|uniref:dynein light chain Tctex-type 5-like n=1 Tax=Babylonia areolata TaxID=304850 RepID=UPI003FD5E11F